MIDIYTCLTKGSHHYANFMGHTLQKTASGKNQIRYFYFYDELCDSHPVNMKPVRQIIPPKKYISASRHGFMLNQLRKYINPDCDIVIVADCDIGILKKGWDEIVVNVLKEKRVFITPKFSGAASIYFTAFNAKDFVKRKIDFRPGTKKNGWKTDTIYHDTGYRITEYYDKGEVEWYKYEGRNKKYSYKYSYNGELIVSHLGASRKNDFYDKKVQTWIKNINNAVQ